jgi:hypothetical protein
VLIEAFLPEPAIEGLDISVVRRLPRTGKVQSDVVPIGPEIDVFRDKFRPVVRWEGMKKEPQPDSPSRRIEKPTTLSMGGAGHDSALW